MHRPCAREFEPQNSKESPFIGGIHVERGTRVCRPAAGSTGRDSRQPKYSDAPTCRARLRHSCQTKPYRSKVTRPLVGRASGTVNPKLTKRLRLSCHLLRAGARQPGGELACRRKEAGGRACAYARWMPLSRRRKAALTLNLNPKSGLPKPVKSATP